VRALAAGAATASMETTVTMVRVERRISSLLLGG
jgi:hypothetical protein